MSRICKECNKRIPNRHRSHLYFEFSTKNEAQAFIDFVCDIEKLDPLKQEDLSIEDFDEADSNRLVQGSICYG